MSEIKLSKTNRFFFKVVVIAIIALFLFLLVYSLFWDWQIGSVKTLHCQDMTYRFDHTSDVSWLKWIFYPFIIACLLVGLLFIKAGEKEK